MDGNLRKLSTAISTACAYMFHRYGLVTKKNASAIVDKCVLGAKVVKANWRGNMANPGNKAKPADKPRQAATVVAAAASAAVPEQAGAESTSVEGAARKVRRDRLSGDGA